MIDTTLNRLAQWIVKELAPNLKTFFTDYFSSTIFDKMTTQELQIFFVKIALEAIIFIILYKIGKYWSKKLRRKKRKYKPREEPVPIPERKWSPTGWYWDDEKQAWIPPDYINKERQEKWKWDPEKRIWIDQNPPK